MKLETPWTPTSPMVNAPAPFDTLSVVRAAAVPGPRDRSLGAILLDAGLIKLDDVERILATQREHGLRFGDAAVKLGVVTEAALKHALAYQFDYPVLAPGEAPVSREVFAAYEAHHPVLDDLRALRNQILLRWLTAENQRNRTVAIMGVGRGEGRTFIAANLAVTFSQMGQRTLLIDADLRRGRLHSLFGTPNQQGLGALLAERNTHSALHRIEGLRDLQVIGTGGEPPNPQDLLSRPSFSTLLEGFAGSHDVVILDTPAAEDGPEAAVIAARARGVVLVARKDHTEMNALAVLAEQTRANGASVIGTALIS